MIKKKYIETLTINQLLNAKIHIGLKKKQWNPLIKSFLFGARHGVHFFDLKQTMPFLKRALHFIKTSTQNHDRVLFVGSHIMITGLISFLSKNTSQHSITKKWVGGTLTNWKRIRGYVKFLNTSTIESIRQKWILRTEKKVDQKIRQYIKMKNLLEGIENLTALPSMVILLEKDEDAYAFNEAVKLMIPIVLLVNTKDSALRVSYPIFGNTNLFDTLFFYSHLIFEAIKEGFHKRRLIFFKKATNFIIPSDNKQTKNALKDFDKYSAIQFNTFYRSFRNYKSIAMKRTLRKFAFMFQSLEKKKKRKKFQVLQQKQKKIDKSSKKKTVPYAFYCIY